MRTPIREDEDVKADGKRSAGSGGNGVFALKIKALCEECPHSVSF